ncbi:hypothetical protein [Brucella pseudintermedia]|uniref:hypothetical protein n=1 Tax=Brucella pseudintermedia TaxID=370111 RepID=UPI000EFBE4C7
MPDIVNAVLIGQTTIEVVNPRASFHLYTVTAWDGQPAIRDREHTELRWFTPQEAEALDDLALEEYRPLFRRLVGTEIRPGSDRF